MDSASPFAAHTEDRIDARLQHPLVPEQEGIAADSLTADRARSLALIEGLRRLNLAIARQQFAATAVRQERESLRRLRDLISHD
jgi:hypothetical protein